MSHDRVESGQRSVPGADEPRLCMHYYDSRGVFRVYEASVDAGTWRLWRDAPEFSQRFTGIVAADGNSISGRWELGEDNVSWRSDLEITYQRQR
ncbi:MAG: hypothetical protein ACOY0T_16990 [Myxococcota bacterium]